MSEQAAGPSKQEFEQLTKLVSDLGDAVEELARAKPAEQPAAQQLVAQKELSLKDHARALGITVEQVQQLKEEEDYARFVRFQERREQETAAAASEGDGDGDGDGDGSGDGDGDGDGQRRDGLGGLRNLLPSS